MSAAGRFVLDLETKRSFEEVGGAHNRAALGVSVVGLYDYAGDRYFCVREDALGSLRGILDGATQVVGFNLLGFDYPVLAAQVGDWVHDLPTLDLMAEVQCALSHRVSLDSLARATLGSGKLGSGLDALQYYRQGDWERLERYCLEDVKLTRHLFEHAEREGTLYFMKGLRRAPVPLAFGTSPFADVFAAAARAQGSVRMRYGGKERLVDVRRFDGLYIRAFCHLKNEELTFRLDRVEDARSVPSSTPLFGP